MTLLQKPFLHGFAVLSCWHISVGITLPRNQVKAHEVRAIASSWSIFNSASLTEILSAGFWRSDNTFYYHYLRSMPQHTDNLDSLWPLVSAQKVIFSPTS
jgi:hypothetical protein